MRNRASRNVAFIAALAVAALLPLSTQAADDGQAERTDLERVPIEHVCMVNDFYFGRDQIPVEVEGKTYYGCCEGCKQRLKEDEAVRQAIDPVTGAEVDKASAVPAARPDGTVLYFQSEENLARYRDR